MQAFKIHPQLHFPGQREAERIILFLRRHGLVLFNKLFLPFVLILIPPIVLLFLPDKYQDALFREPLVGLIVLGLSAYYLMLWLAIFLFFVDYYLDIWVLTDQRIVNIEQRGLFHRVISELNILRVQDVTSEVRGVIPTFLDYGDVHVQTAGTRKRFHFYQVPHPEEVKKMILKTYEVALKGLKPEELKKAQKILRQKDKLDNEERKDF